MPTYDAKSLVYKTGEPWGKRTPSGLIDVTMGSFDCAETCELVGAYLQHNIKDKHDYAFGLYGKESFDKPAPIYKKAL